jgi:hypothetical protein
VTTASRSARSRERDAGQGGPEGKATIVNVLLKLIFGQVASKADPLDKCEVDGEG